MRSSMHLGLDHKPFEVESGVQTVFEAAYFQMHRLCLLQTIFFRIIQGGILSSSEKPEFFFFFLEERWKSAFFPTVTR